MNPFESIVSSVPRAITNPSSSDLATNIATMVNNENKPILAIVGNTLIFLVAGGLAITMGLLSTPEDPRTFQKT
jgi:hypothetical protein